MGLELLSQADYVLNACGRPVPPKGYRFVDLPKIIPFHSQFSLPAWDFPPVPDSGNGDFIIQSRGSQSLTVTATNDGGSPTGVTVVGTMITVNIADMITTVATVVAAINSNPAFAAIAVAIGTGNTALLAQNPTSVVPFSVAPAPTQNRVQNLSNTLFLCRGIVFQTDPVSVRIKWPNGRYFNQFPSNNPQATLNAGANFPQGTGGNMFALDEEMPIETGGKIAVEMSGGNPGPVDIQFWGVLRYLLKATGSDLAEVDGETCIIGYPSQAQSQKAPQCLIGYPVPASAKGKQGSVMIPDPVAVLKSRQRFHCWPNGNILAPEFLLGNQCEMDPYGDPEPYTFLSDIYTMAAGGQSYSNSVVVPGQDDIRIRRWRAITTWSGGAGTPQVGLRSPSGYSLTGGDLIPINLGFWYPMFPTLVLRHGTEIIVDVAFPATNTGSVSVQIEFDAAKIRRPQ